MLGSFWIGFSLTALTDTLPAKSRKIVINVGFSQV